MWHVSSHRLFDNFKKLKWPALPVMNCNVRVATGTKYSNGLVPGKPGSKQVTEQIYMPISVKRVQTDITVLVLPKLIHKCNVCVDTLKEWDTGMNFKDSYVNVVINQISLIMEMGKLTGIEVINMTTTIPTKVYNDVILVKENND